MNIRLLHAISFCLATAAMSLPASAADMAARPRKAPPPQAVVAVYDWSGFYIGANAGYGSSRSCLDFVTFDGQPFAEPDGCHNATGGTAGGQFGYRWQMGTWVFGAEAQGNWADLNGSTASQVFADTTVHSRLKSFGLFTGQVGYAWNNLLFYAKGGAAVVNNDYSYRFTFLNQNFLLNSATNTRWGGTIGVGVEYGFAPGWSLGLEYNHLFLGRDTIAFAAGPAPVGVPSTNSVGQDVDLVTARINYRFGGPPVFRY